MEAPTPAKAKKEFSEETRAKLSAAMKARWARTRAAKAEHMQSLTAHAPIYPLYEAAAVLVEDEELKAAIVEGVQTSTIVLALEAERSAGTNLQVNIRKILVAKIKEAIESL